MTTQQRDPTPIPPPGGARAERPGTVETRPTEEAPARRPRVRGREPVLRVPGVSPIAPFAGWLSAWGAAVVAAACLQAAGVSLGLGLGIAERTELGVDAGLGAGLAVLIVQGGAFIVGGYIAARMARVAGVSHAVLAWALAMLATGADAIVQGLRDAPSVLSRLPGIPYWIDTGLGGTGSLIVALGVLALAGLAGALIGGSLGSLANRAARRDPADLVTTSAR